MFIRAMLVIIMVNLLTACETMLNHTKLQDDGTITIATGSVYVNYCNQRGLMSSRITADFNRATARMLASHVENKELFSRTYQQELANAQLLSATMLSEHCKEAEPYVPEMIATMNQGSSHAEQWRSSTFIRPSGKALRDYSRDPIPIQLPSGEVTFGLKEKNSTNVLIRSSEGTRICNVRSGGGVGLATCF